MSEVEQAEVQRRRWLVGAFVSGTIWLVAMFIRDALPAEHPAQMPLKGFYLVGVFVWSYYLIRIVGLTFRMLRNRPLDRALNDERVLLSRLKAWTFGFWCVLAMQVIWVAIKLYAPHLATVDNILNGNILIMNMAAIGAFLYLDTKGKEGDDLP